MLLNKKQSCYVYDRIDNELHFRPGYNVGRYLFNQKPPFEINKSYIIYDIKNVTDEQVDIMNDIISKCFIEASDENDRIYAIDWNHEEFICKPSDLKNKKDESGHYLPCFYPDGDYYFFISEDFRFGYLAHPWRMEVWIFGTDLINAVSVKAYLLGWTEKKRSIT